MNFQSIVALLVIIVLAVLVGAFMYRKHKKNGGHCADCDANCPFRKQ